MRSASLLAIYLGLCGFWSILLYGFRRGLALTWLVLVVALSGIATHFLTVRYHDQIVSARAFVSLVALPFGGIALVIGTYYLSSLAVRTLFERD